jgi:hypothetical protein
MVEKKKRQCYTRPNSNYKSSMIWMTSKRIQSYHIVSRGHRSYKKFKVIYLKKKEYRIKIPSLVELSLQLRYQ